MGLRRKEIMTAPEEKLTFFIVRNRVKIIGKTITKNLLDLLL
jgi:hypothetical protein